MNRLFVLFVSVFVIASVSQAEKDGPPGQPFEQINQRLDDVNVKLDENKDVISEVSRAVAIGLKSGAKHWVSPKWVVLRSAPGGDGQITDWSTRLYVLNSSAVFPAVVKVNLYDVSGNLVDVQNNSIEIPPLGSFPITVRALLIPSDHTATSGWVEVVSNIDVFVDGSILTEHDTGLTGLLTRYERTMTWYRIDSE